MSPILFDVSWRKVRVLLQVCLLIFWASVKSAMQLGTVKYSGRAISAGFCFAALRTAVLAAIRFCSKVLRISMCRMLTFKLGSSLWVYVVVFVHLNVVLWYVDE